LSPTKTNKKNEEEELLYIDFITARRRVRASADGEGQAIAHSLHEGEGANKKDKSR
jgi:hypothetical protein